MSRATGRITVLVTGPALVGTGAGIQQHVRYLCEAFRSTPRGIHVLPFAVTSAEYREPWLRKGLRLLGVYLRFPRAVAACDVVHVNSTLDRRSVIRDAILTLIARLMRRPVVVQFHGGGLHRLRGPAGVLAGWLGRMFRLADTVLFLSETQGRPVTEAWSLRSVVYVGNYVDVGRFEEPDDPEPDSLNILFLGRLDEEKGPLETVDAFRQVAGPLWHLRIAGAGPCASRVQELAGEDDRIEYCGYVGPSERDSLVRWADVLALPSDHDEGLPYAVLEAAAAGTALVTSNKGALGSVVIPGKTGFIVAPRCVDDLASALVLLAEDSKSTGRMKRAARELVRERYDFARMVETFAGIWCPLGARA